MIIFEKMEGSGGSIGSRLLFIVFFGGLDEDKVGYFIFKLSRENFSDKIGYDEFFNVLINEGSCVDFYDKLVCIKIDYELEVIDGDYIILELELMEEKKNLENFYIYFVLEK